MSLDAIGIVSKNITESVRFYSILGVELKEAGGDNHFEGMTASGVRIMIDSAELIKKLNPNWVDPAGCGVVLCFKQDSPDEVDKLYEAVIRAGFKAIKAPWDAFWGQRYASIMGPDSNQVDIFAAL